MDDKFVAQKDSLCEVAKDICSSMAKEFETMFLGTNSKVK